MSPKERIRPQSHAAKRSTVSAGERRIVILAVLLLAAGVLMFLALISYDPVDEAKADLSIRDLLNLFSGDPEVRERADTAQNWLGLVGAVLAHFLINGTFGYSILFLPLMLMAFGWKILRRDDLRVLLLPLMYLSLGALLVSALFGMARAVIGQETIGMRWSGVVGDFVATLLTQLAGKAGGTIIIVTCILLFVVWVADIDIRLLIDRVRSVTLRVVDWLSRKREEWAERKGKDAAAPTSPPRVNDRVSVRVSNAEEEPEELPAPRTIEQKPIGSERSTPERQPASGLRVAIDRREPEEELPDGAPAPGTSRQEEIDYVFPSVELLETPPAAKTEVDEDELKANADLLRDTLAEFDVEVESVSVTPGPVVTLYELVPSAGVKISRIVSLENDIALKLAAKGIRIMAPIPGKSAVGVEIPNHHRAIVSVRSVLNSTRFRDTRALLPLAMGKTIAGEVFTDDLSRMPHLLIAGSTGSGKSVGINTILASLLYRMHPSELKLVIIDPKKIELAQYAKLRNHFLAISPDVDEEIITNPRNAVLVLRGVEYEMEKRYDRLAAAGVRSIGDYNERLKAGRLKNTETVTHTPMPYLVVLIDELADLMITAAREVEEPIARLAQLARAVGIHLVVATQRPSVDVITGVIKANFSARIAYQVASKTDSRTILDMNGAEQLLGNGDLLYLASGSPKPVRLQNAFISTDEVEAVVDHIARQRGFSHPFVLPSITEKKKNGGEAGGGDRDELFEEAARLIVRHQQGSVSLLQRRLKVGYSRAARLVDELEAAGIVGPFDGSKARNVLVESETDLELILKGQ